MKTLITTLLLILTVGYLQAQQITIHYWDSQHGEICMEDYQAPSWGTLTYEWHVTHIQSGTHWVYYDDSNNNCHPFEFFYQGNYNITCLVRVVNKYNHNSYGYAIYHLNIYHD